MCLHEDDYQYLPPMSFGGPAGDYFVSCPIQACRWAEVAVVNLCNMGSGAPGTASVSANARALKSGALQVNGSATFNDDVFFDGIIYKVADFTNISLHPFFFRVTNSQKRLYARLDPNNGVSMYVTVQFRVKLLTVVPGPSVAVPPEAQEQINIARADTTMKRLQRMGIPGYEVETHGR